MTNDGNKWQRWSVKQAKADVINSNSRPFCCFEMEFYRVVQISVHIATLTSNDTHSQTSEIKVRFWIWKNVNCLVLWDEQSIRTDPEKLEFQMVTQTICLSNSEICSVVCWQIFGYAQVTTMPRKIGPIPANVVIVAESVWLSSKLLTDFNATWYVVDGFRCVNSTWRVTARRVASWVYSPPISVIIMWVPVIPL